MDPPPDTDPVAPALRARGGGAAGVGCGEADKHAVLRTVLDQLPVGTAIVRAPDGAVVFASAACARLLGKTAAWAAHGFAFDRWAPSHLDGQPVAREARPVWRALAGESVTAETYALPCTDGSTVVLRIHAGPIRGADGAIVACIVAFEDVTREHRARAALEERVTVRTAEVRALTAALTLAEQRERARIAQVLHDDLQQVLYGARLQLHGIIEELSQVSGYAAEPAGEAEHHASRSSLLRAHELLGQALRLTRALTLDLRPPVSAEEGLAASLTWLARHLRDVHGLEIAVHDEGAPPLPPDVHDLLFQLTRELLFNVVKHAGVGEATVTLRTESGAGDGVLVLAVEDGGRGFDASALATAMRPEGGLGLRSVRERLALLGGRMAVRSAPAAGTRITLTLPLRDAGAAAEPSAPPARS